MQIADFVSPQALEQAHRILGSGESGGPAGPVETPDDKMYMVQQKHELDIAREAMKQDHAMKMEAYKAQTALGQKYADSQFKQQEMKMQSSMQPKVAQPVKSSPQAQQATQNQYYNAPAMGQVPQYLGNQFV